MMFYNVLYVLKLKVMALLKNKMRIISWFTATSPGYPADFDLSKPIQKKRLARNFRSKVGDDSDSWISPPFSMISNLGLSAKSWDIDVKS